jgi:hypothetical protein
MNNESSLDQMDFDVGSCVIGILGFGIVRIGIKKMIISFTGPGPCDFCELGRVQDRLELTQVLEVD